MYSGPSLCILNLRLDYIALYIFVLYSFVTDCVLCILSFCEVFIRLCIFKIQVQTCQCHLRERKQCSELSWKQSNN